MRVLHLPANTATQASVAVRALRGVGVEARGIVLSNHQYCSSAGLLNYIRRGIRRHPISGVAHTLRYWSAVLRHILWADVVHWYGPSSTVYRDIDLKLLAFLGKPRIVEFWGSDIRIPEIASRDNPYIARMYGERPELAEGRRAASLRFQEKFHRYGFGCAVAYHELLPYVHQEYFPSPYVTRQRVMLSEYSVRLPDPGTTRPLVVHCPSNSAIKGTDAVLRTVEKLRSRYQFDFRMIHGMPRQDALDMMASCDVYLDQFTIGAYGLAALEAMAFGKPTLCYIKPSLIGAYPSDMPIVNASQDNLAGVLESLLRDGLFRQNIGRRSRAYVEEYHDAYKIARQVLGIYKDLIEKQRGTGA